jgi:hypothetical protein
MKAVAINGSPRKVENPGSSWPATAGRDPRRGTPETGTHDEYARIIYDL